MPKTFSGNKNDKNKPKSEIDLSIENAEKAQGLNEEQEDTEKHISGSENIWESSAEMTQITNKLTRDKNWKSPKQLAKEKKAKENAEKERIRQEILQAEPVDDQDIGFFSGYLAQKSQKSKSEEEIKAEAELKRQKAQDEKEKLEKQRQVKLK